MKDKPIDTDREIRDQIDGLIARAAPDSAPAALEAHALLAQLWRGNRGGATAAFVVSRFETLRDRLPTVHCKLAILRSFTVEPIVQLARASAAAALIDLDVQVGDFNTYAQDLLDPGSKLYQYSPDVVVLAVQTRDIAPELWQNFTDLNVNDVDATITRVVASYRGWVDAFRSRSQAHVILHGLELPPRPSAGVLDGQTDQSQTAAIRSINTQLCQIAAEQMGVYLLDYESLVARHGRLNWYDAQKWLSVRLPMVADRLIDVSDEWLRFLHPITGKICKCLVCDLDNTLWGGVIGEDGIDGIQVGVEYPGAAFGQFQRAILDLHQRGIILAICSKNNHDDAMAALEKHPGMLLRPDHFNSLRINWRDKAQNLREIAAELNIGIDALAFVDDNPVERQFVRSQLPEVTVVELSDDPLTYAASLRDCPVFERLAISAEDRNRGQMYTDERQRADLETGSATLEDFYHSLDMQAEITLVTPQTVSRVAQLTQKTNQLNMTTRRYSEQQITSLADDPACRVYCVQVRDRFGDSGIVGVMITRQRGSSCELDTFLMSCRVIGRTVETAMLATVVRHAGAAGMTQLAGEFLPTKKNAPAEDIYRDHGFACSSGGETASLWTFDLAAGTIEVPEWIRCQVLIEETE